jgi:hypothetical protein
MANSHYGVNRGVWLKEQVDSGAMTSIDADKQVSSEESSLHLEASGAISVWTTQGRLLQKLTDIQSGRSESGASSWKPVRRSQ